MVGSNIYRAKLLSSHEWIYGHYVIISGETFILPYDYLTINNNKITSSSDEIPHVDPETITKSTGILDVQGSLIFEGDIIVPTAENRLNNCPSLVKPFSISCYWNCIKNENHKTLETFTIIPNYLNSAIIQAATLCVIKTDRGCFIHNISATANNWSC